MDIENGTLGSKSEKRSILVEGRVVAIGNEGRMSKLRSQRLKRSSLRGQEVVNKKSEARSRNRRDRKSEVTFRTPKAKVRNPNFW